MRHIQMAEPRTSISMTSETLDLLSGWKKKVEDAKGLPEQSWDQFLSYVARSGVVP